MNKYIAFDVETGGIDPEKVSLLTAYFAVLDENFETTHELSLTIKQDMYSVTAEALGINNINLVTHHNDPVSLDQREAGTKLFEFLRRVSDEGASKLIPIGHNVSFDIGFITLGAGKLLTKKSWNQFVSYRLLDTGVIAQFLKAKGSMPEEISGSLGSLQKHFDVPADVAHTADGDVRMTVNVLVAMLEE